MPDLNGLSRGWLVTTLGEVTTPAGKTVPSDRPEEVFTYLDISSIDNGTNTIVDPKVMPGRDAPSRARQHVFANDVLFSTVRTYLRNIALVPDQFDGQVASTGFCVLRGNGAALGKYLFYYLLTDDFIESVSKLQRGVSYPAVRDDDVRAHNIPLAPLAEQKRIVDAIEAHFTRLDAAVEALQRVQANLKRYRASVLKAACEGRLVPTEAELAAQEGRAYEHASVLLARILAERRAQWEAAEWDKLIEKAKKKAAQVARRAAGRPARLSDLDDSEWQDLPESAYAKYLPKNDSWKQKYKEPPLPDTSDLPALPGGWVYASLEQLSWDSGYGTSQKCDYDAPGPIVLRIPNIVAGDIMLYDLKHATRPQDLAVDGAISPGDVLIVRTNGSPELIGRSAVVRRELEQVAYFASYLIRYRLQAFPILWDWVSAIWNAPIHREWMQSEAATSAGQYNISVGTLNRFLLPLPPYEEQTRIAQEVERELSIVDELGAACESSLQRAERLRQAILKRAFEGKLVPQDPNDEPASELLKRIRRARVTEAVGTKISFTQLPLMDTK